MMKVSIIGFGHVGTNIALALHRQGFVIDAIVGRDEEHLSSWAKRLGANYFLRPEDVPSNSDLYLLSVPDHVLHEVLYSTGLKDAFIVHTSGSLPMDVLSNYTSRGGVLYPLQTFDKHRLVDFSTIPCFCEGADESILSDILSVARLISRDVSPMNSEQRKSLHVAAVFACNFTNHCYAIAEDIGEQYGINIEVLEPLIKETFEKRVGRRSKEVQTGPAIRGDGNVISAHLDFLGKHPTWRGLYESLSHSIGEMYNEDEKKK